MGREADLERLTAAMRAGGRIIIEGASGVGKTTLASVFAWNASSDYPDGVVFVDLQGGSDRLSPERAMRHVLWLRHSGPVIVDSQFDLHGAYRAVLRERRILLVLDNAADAAQVAPLIPPAPSAVIVTARQSLASLDLDALVLEPLERVASIDLLRSCGCGSDHAARLAAVCGDLPLVLRVVAREAARTDCDVDELLRELEGEQSRLRALDAIAPAGQISASLQRSISTLTAELRRALGQLQVFPQELDRASAARVWDVEPRQARTMLRELSMRHLIQHCSGRGSNARYRVHDLVRIAAAAQATETDVTGARFRHAQHYLRFLRPFDPLAPDAAEDIAEVSAQIQADAANLYTALHWCAERAPKCRETAMLLPRVHRAWVLNLMLGPNLPSDARGAVHGQSDGPSRAWMPQLWLKLGDLCRQEGDYETARRALERAVSEMSSLDNPHLVQLAGIMLALTWVTQGEKDRALAVIRPYMRLARQRGDTLWQSFALLVLGLVFLGIDERKAEALFTASLAADPRANPSVRSETKCGLAICLAQRGELRRAHALASEALDDARSVGPLLTSDREASSLTTLGLVYLHSDLEAAARYADEAVRVAEVGAYGHGRVRALSVRAAIALVTPAWMDAAPFVEAALQLDASMQPYAHRYLTRDIAAQFMIRAQRFDEAVALLASLVQEDPAGRIGARRYCEFRLQLAGLLETLGRNDTARNHTAAALECISRFRLHADRSLLARTQILHARLAAADAA